ncbi:MAG: phospholipase D family protein [Pseudomonadota bacterium]
MRSASGLICATGLWLAMAGCASLPPLAGRGVSNVLANTESTKLGMAVAPLTAAHPGLSGVYALPGGADAFAVRMLLANTAMRSLDVQYYIWHKDITGMLLLDALRAAAGRGVRVRLLLDDNNTAGLDQILARFDAIANVEVRLFNPFPLRSPRALGYLSDFFRLNRRMHNKSFTIDNQATIVGGRNIGDEYFGAAGDVLFSDLDVVAIGPVVDAVSHDFDRYWNSDSAYPLRLLVPAAGANGAALFDQEVMRTGRSPAGLAYLEAMRVSPFVAQLSERRLPLEWAVTHLVSDDPDKVLGQATQQSKVLPQLVEMVGQPAAALDLVSPYFVPGEAGAAAFGAMARRGVQVRILTNSFEATDVTPVHAGYAKWRKSLLASGVRLFEMRRAWADSGQREGAGVGSGGSSASSLHAKTFSVDGARVFVGSFNFDQRSFNLNTEMGLVIDSVALAGQLTGALNQRLPAHAYEVRLNPDGSLYWVEHNGGVALRHDSEPGTSYWQRIGLGLMTVLPIDSML